MAAADVRTLEEYLDLPYRVGITRDEATSEWVAHVEELAGCEARGLTLPEAAGAIRSAMQEWIREALAEEREVPEPSQRTHSGRLLVRMPPTLHAELARVADDEGVSLNQLITGALASAVGWRNGRPAGGGGASAGRARSAKVLLVANLAALALACAAAVALLVFAWRHGF